MSWFRFHQAPEAILSRSKRHCPYAGDLLLSGGGGGAQARVSKEDCSQIGYTRERGFLGRHQNGFISDRSAKLKNIISIPFLDNQFLAFTAIRCKLMPAQSNCRSITTRASDHEQELLKAMELFLSTVKDETISMKEMYSTYIENLCRSGNLSDAAYLSSHLCDRGIHPNLNTYNILLASANKASDFEHFSKIFKSLLLSKQPPDFTSYVNVAKAFQYVADSNLLLEFIVEVSEITVQRDPTVINRIIFITAKSGQIDKSVMMFEGLKNLDCKLDAVTFNTVLAVLGSAGRVDQMMREFTSMKDLGHAPDLCTCNTLVNSMRRLGRLNLCKDFAKEMVERGIELDLRTYTALIDAFGRAGHVEDAVRIFGEMKKSHHPSIYVYRALIGNLKKAGKFEQAVDLVEEMNSSVSKLIGPADFRKKRTKKK